MSAFVLRINQTDKNFKPFEEALEQSHISIGWAKVDGLIHVDDREQLRELVHRCYYSRDKIKRRSGSAAGNLWRFIHVMEQGDYVVVPDPHPNTAGFYVARVESDAYYDPKNVANDSAYRRKVTWLNGGRAFSRSNASGVLQKCLSRQLTITQANNLEEELITYLKTTL